MIHADHINELANAARALLDASYETRDMHEERVRLITILAIVEAQGFGKREDEKENG